MTLNTRFLRDKTLEEHDNGNPGQEKKYPTGSCGIDELHRPNKLNPKQHPSEFTTDLPSGTTTFEARRTTMSNMNKNATHKKRVVLRRSRERFFGHFRKF